MQRRTIGLHKNYVTNAAWRALFSAGVATLFAVHPARADAHDPSLLRENLVGDYFLEGDSCEQLQPWVQTLREWTRIFDGSVAPAPKCVRLANPAEWQRPFRVGLRGSFPKRYVPAATESSERNGPNCFSAVTYGLGFTSAMRHVTAAELADWMQSDRCRKLPPDPSARQPGDVALVYQELASDPRRGLVHAYLWLSSELAWSKASLDNDEILKLQRHREVMSAYSVPHRCYGARNAGCDAWTEYYRCEPMRDPGSRLRARIAGPASDDFLSFERRVEVLESAMSRAIYDWHDPVPAGAYAGAVQKLRDEAAQLAGRASPVEQPAWHAIALKLESLARQDAMP